ncbi:MAG: hypothetical protein JWM53_825, partial [bacterium]|nr:hypothetical protein [bacterium]
FVLAWGANAATFLDRLDGFSRITDPT